MSLPRFGVRRPVPANLLMMAIIIAGLTVGVGLRREFFPSVDAEAAAVTLPYPGATPEEIEETLAIKVEDKLWDLEEVDELSTSVFEGGGAITVTFKEGENPYRALDEVQRAIDSLQDLPDESEEINVELIEPRLPAIQLILFGDADERVRKTVLRKIKDELESLRGMGETLEEGVRDYELRIDVNQPAMLREGLNLPQVADAVRAEMIEVPGGTVKTQGGYIKVRALGADERAQAVRDIVLRADERGRVLRLGDIAEVNESFIDDPIINRYNGQPASVLTVFQVGEQDIVEIAEMVRAYIAGRRGEPFVPTWFERVAGVVDQLSGGRTSFARTHRVEAYELAVNSTQPLPPGLEVRPATDLARFVEGRLDLLTRNAFYGAILVFATLLAFLNYRVAGWVGVGLVTALAGTLVLMWVFGVTLNLLTMFGLIVVLGLLVDDAIVVSENIVARHEKGEPALAAAIHGAEQVAWPVVATVTTSIVAFLPLTFIEGNIGDLLGALPMVVAVALAMSLLESVYILPSHMGHSLQARDRSKASPNRLARWLIAAEDWRDNTLIARVTQRFGQLIDLSLRYRYVSVALALGVLIGSLGMIAGGRVVFEFLPRNDAETIVVRVKMPIGTPIERTDAIVGIIERAAERQPEVVAINAQVGQISNIDTGQAEALSPHSAQMFIELLATEQRDVPSDTITQRIRDAVQGRVDEAESISWEGITGGPGGADISIQLIGPDSAKLAQAAIATRETLGRYANVIDTKDDNDLGQLELRWRITPKGRALGFTQADLATQLRGFLFGIDAHVYAAQREDIDVRVRLDEATRRDLAAIENLWLVNSRGRSVPLMEVARVEDAVTYATIRRVDRQRAITVSADVATGVSPEIVTTAFTTPAEPENTDEPVGDRAEVGNDAAGSMDPTTAGLSPLDQLRHRFPGVKFEFTGRQEQQAEAFASLPYGFMAAMVMVYIILAMLFSSYWQPFTVLAAVPFALIGVVWGHYLLGYSMTFLSIIGMVALSGVVVNDSLILVKFYNECRQSGESVHDALVHAGKARLRAILMTTITTVLGLTPLILEQSFQAKFLIPMAIALAGGLISTTVIILLVLPCFIVIAHDLADVAHFLWHGEKRRVKAGATPPIVAVK